MNFLHLKSSKGKNKYVINVAPTLQIEGMYDVSHNTDACSFIWSLTFFQISTCQCRCRVWW